MKARLIILNIVTISILSCLQVIAQDKLYHKSFSLSDVKLLEGPFKHAQDLNVDVLLQYEPDRFLAPFLKVAGITPKAENYPNWESDGLDGHVGGHYITAMAIHYASTGNEECKRRMDYMISELKTCQEANSKKYPDWGVGYIGGVPNSDELFKKIMSGDVGAVWNYWVPWYNLHKTFAGLRDAWLYGGNETAKEMFIKLCDWAVNVISPLSDEQIESMLGQEYGGMNEVLADACQITGNEKYLVAAKRFSHKALLAPLAEGNDILDNKHANTQIPKFIGFQRIAELSNDPIYAKSSVNFWETVTGNRSLAFGGNSRKEHFPSVNSCTDYIDDVEGPESCNTYNMLKLTEDLFWVNPQARYVDFYERALYNHILSTQHPDHGGYVYFTPTRPRHYRVYSAPNKAMWCCVGSGMENHGKYNEFIYSHSDDSLFLNLFIASELNWKEKGMVIRQETLFPENEKTTLKIVKGKSNFPLLIRYPSWVRSGELKVKINGKEQPIKASPSSYFSINRMWKKGDVVEIELPMHNTIEKLPNVPEYGAILHGPIVLAAKTGTEDLRGIVAGAGRWEHIAGGRKLPIDQTPILVDDKITELDDKLIKVEGKTLTYKFGDIKIINPINVEMEPFYKIHDARYIMYWMTLTGDQYAFYLDSITQLEKAKLELENRTIDHVSPGEQQPESDHDIQSANSNTGNSNDQFWREARNNGYFSYKLTTNGETNLALMVRYWGSSWGGRKFEIYIDGQKLISEDNTGRWNLSKFQEVEYDIPESMLQGKNEIRVKFQAIPGNTIGPVYNIRLFRK